MFKAGATLSLFPTFVLVRDLAPADAERLNATIMRRLAILAADRPAQGDGRSWQTHAALHLDPEFAEFGRYVLAASSQFLELMDYRPDPLEITGCWANISPVGAAHHMHSHPNNLLSGVYYVQAAPGANTITFYDPRPQAHVIAPHILKTSGANASALFPEARAGRFYLFPGWLQHSVDPNRSDRDRISVSFNTMISSFTERVSNPRWQRKFGGEPSSGPPGGVAR
jgi:uncharacterized protein (TIGR02466 family)